MNAETVLELQGLICPLPVLKAQKALKGMAAGSRLVVLATDPSAVKDFDAFCAAAGHVLVESSERDGVFRFCIEKQG